MERNKKEKVLACNRGITLITLIITITILIILVGTGLKLVIDGNVVESAENSVDKGNNRVAVEQGILDEAMGEWGDLPELQCPHRWREWTIINENEKTRTCTVCNITQTLKITENYYATITNTIGRKISNYKIYGNSVQDGTPTTNTPVEIESVGDKTKNLLPVKGTINHQIKNLNISIEDDIITINGTINVNSQMGLYRENEELKSITGVIGIDRDNTPLLKLKEGTYTQSLKYLSGTIKNENSTMYVGLYTQKNGEKIVDTRKNFYEEDSQFTFTISEDKEVQFFVIQFVAINGSITFDNYKFKFQLEEGTAATEYEPYGYYKIPVEVSGKNKFSYNVLEENNFIRVLDEETGEFEFIKTSGIPSTPVDAKENKAYNISFKTMAAKKQTIFFTVYYTDGTSKGFSKERSCW